ncbi:MAG: hypothetical protein ACRDGV_04270 [Candidatus Limnocylindria bacterium]
MRTASASLGFLIGTWEFEASVDGRFLGRGRATFEWIEDGAFVREHAEDQPSADADPEWVAHSPMPVTAIIGFDDTTLEHAMLYSDARGVLRIYRMSLTDDTWRLWRAAPDFHQRFIGTFRDDGRTIEGRWESSPDGSAWEPDFDMTYRSVVS